MGQLDNDIDNAIINAINTLRNNKKQPNEDALLELIKKDTTSITKTY